MNTVIKQTDDQTLTQQILELTLVINTRYPELSKYLTEMPVTLPTSNDPEISKNTLQEYYESLVTLVKTYELELQTKQE